MKTTFTLGIFYERHAGCMPDVDSGQYGVDAGLSDVDALQPSANAGCMSIVKYV